MEKLRLSLDELNVQTFVTANARPQLQGTVRAHGYSEDCPTTVENGCWAESFGETCGCGESDYVCGDDTFMCGPFWGETMVMSDC